MRNTAAYFFFILMGFQCFSQVKTPSSVDLRLYEIIDSVSAERIEADIRALANFGTRHTFSDTLSDTRGIGAARRWIKSGFEKIAEKCNDCLEVYFQKSYITPKDSERVPFGASIVNVVAIQRGTEYPDRYIIISGDIDSRVSDVMDYTSDSPGANDNASGMAGTIEAARVLSKYNFKSSIVYLGLSGEEQGLFGGKAFAKMAQEKGWKIIGVFNNDMIGNIHGVDGVIDNRSFRIFSEPTDPTDTEREQRMRRYYGGAVDGISRQLARYVHKTTQKYMPEMNPMMINRLDRFGRGGHHKPFCDLGFAGIRIMEAHENYNHQHQDIRKENGIQYGDLIQFVNFDYAKKLTAVNAINLASLAWAPPPPKNVKIGGIVEASAKFRWEKANGNEIAGYKIHWRKTTSPQWEYSRFVGNVDHFTLKGIVIDNYFFGVSSVGKNGHESVVVFPSDVFRE